MHFKNYHMSDTIPRNTLERLTAVDFQLLGEWKQVNNALLYDLTPETPANLARLKGSALYAFVCQESVIYIGKTSVSLKQRFVGYCKPGAEQSTNKKCHKAIRTKLSAGETVQIYSLSGGTRLSWGDFEINLAAGLEDSLINELDPPLNGRSGTRAMTDSEVFERQVLHLPNPASEPESQKFTANDAAKADAVPAKDKNLPFTVQLGKTYYFKGFINVPAKLSTQLGKHDDTLVFFLGRENSTTVTTKIDRKANLNGSPRLYGGQKVARWFQNHFQEGDKVKATIVSANEIILEAPENK